MPRVAVKIKKILDNKVSLWARPPALMWQYAFELSKKKIRRSAKTTDFDQACRIATEAYIDARALDKAGVSIVTHSFKSVANLAIETMENATKSGNGKSAYTSYISALKNYHIPFFGNKNIENIDQQSLAEFAKWRIEKFGGALAHSTINSHISALNRVFDTAVERKFITRSQVPEQNNDGEDAERRPDFTHDEVEKLRKFMPTWVAKAKNGQNQHTRAILRDYVEFLLVTGVRPGTETKGLQWKHIRYDDVDGIPHLCVSVKGKTGRREITITHSAIKILTRLAARQTIFKGKSVGDVIDAKSSAYVFAMPDGKEIKNVRQPFAVMIKESGLEIDPRSGDNRTLYSCRHYFITHALASGATCEEVAPHCGTSMPMIQKFYYHPDLLANGRKIMKLRRGGKVLKEED